MRTHPVFLLALACGCAGAFTPARAQVPEAPARYDADLLSAEFHRGRRTEVMARLPHNALAIFFAAPVRNRSNDVNFEYRQDSDFLYLTGSAEAGSVLVLAPGGVEVDGRTVREILFVPPRDPAQEVWTGRRLGTERAERDLGMERALDATRFADVMGPFLANPAYKVYHVDLPDGVPAWSELETQLGVFLEHQDPVRVTAPGTTGYVLRAVLRTADPDAWRRLRGYAVASVDPTALRDPTLRALASNLIASASFEDWKVRREELLAGRPDGVTLRRVLDELRTVKTDEEMALLKRAIEITEEAHREVMRQVEAGWAEYQIEALVEYTFKRNGAEEPGFPSIVGSGENSTILHYETNRRVTRPGEVVVVDIGAEYHGYSADVTRTVPLDGRFSPEQRAIYQLVYDAQEAGIAASRAGAGFADPGQEAARVFAEGLARLGLIREASDTRGLRRFFMHGTSHYLGLDVHDVGLQGELVPGAVITVEPGLYIAPAEDIDPRWWNIGVRIEDDVLITEDGPVILSGDAPRHPDDVERMMQGRPVSDG